LLLILDVLDKAIQVEDKRAEQMPLPLKQSPILTENLSVKSPIEFVSQYDDLIKVSTLFYMRESFSVF